MSSKFYLQVSFQICSANCCVEAKQQAPQNAA
jgi:hypothetical protein